MTIAFFMNAWQGDIANAKLAIASVHRWFPSSNVYVLVQQPCILDAWWSEYAERCKAILLPIDCNKSVIKGETWLKQSFNLLLANSKEQFFVSIDPDSRVQSWFVPPFAHEYAGQLFADGYGLQCVYTCGCFFQRKALQKMADWLAKYRLAEFTSNSQRFVHALEPWSFGKDRAIGFIANQLGIKPAIWPALYFSKSACLPDVCKLGYITHPHRPQIVDNSNACMIQ